mmetsp:Transcript_2967/g.5627  ORF Transcript_2967/g.5627 Transcript_2967/m.5627 type:complete len:432 (+) Transcript_2967:3-1298(+)
MARIPALTATLCALGLVARSEFQSKTLVILDDPTLPQSHSIFFKNLKNRGHELTITSAKNRTLKMGKYGQFDYDNVILFSPSTEDFGGDFDVDHILNFIEDGRNALVIVDEKPTETNREVANECGVDFDEDSTAVVDHVSHDSTSEDGSHSKIIAKLSPVSKKFVGDIDAPIVYRGLGHVVNEDSPLVFGLLTASATAYSHAGGKVKDFPQSAGTDTLLVSAVQARNNARLVFVGSKELFSNEFFNSPIQDSTDGKYYEKPGNEDFADAATKWAFKEKGLLRAVNFTHRRVGSDEANPSVYRMRDDAVVEVVIQEYDGKTDSWKPFIADDVQLEFIMLDPYVRTTLTHNNKGLFTTSFKVPDVYGCYKLVLKYDRPGYSFLDVKAQTKVRPFQHNEYERFLLVAYPYYASAFSMMAGFFIFGLYFMFGVSP